jgi:hypothetical protein
VEFIRKSRAVYSPLVIVPLSGFGSETMLFWNVITEKDAIFFDLVLRPRFKSGPSAQGKKVFRGAILIKFTGLVKVTMEVDCLVIG